MRKYIYFCLFLAGVLNIVACSEKGDYTTSFYKVFQSESDSGRYLINLTRQLVHTQEYDTVSQESIPMEQIYYSGTITDKEAGGRPVAITATHKSGQKHLQLTYPIGSSDTMGVLSVKISGNGKVLEGWNGKKVESQNKNLPDSVPFKAVEIQPAKITFKFHSGTGEIKVFDSIENSPSLSYSFVVLEPIPTEIDSNLFKKVKKKIYDIYYISDTVSDPLQAVINIRSDDFLKTYQDENPEYYLEEDAYRFFSSLSRNIEVVANSSSILSLVMKADDYRAGAAHNQYGSKYYNFNLQNGALMHLSDVLNREGYQRISNLITQQIRRQNGLKPGQSLRAAYYNYDAVKYNDNFFINEYGIGFHYNAYEIASFASGETTVFVPFKALEGCLSKTMLGLLGI